MQDDRIYIKNLNMQNNIYCSRQTKYTLKAKRDTWEYEQIQDDAYVVV